MKNKAFEFRIYPEVKNLSVKEWFCDWCQTYRDRDENAANNKGSLP